MQFSFDVKIKLAMSRFCDSRSGMKRSDMRDGVPPPSNPLTTDPGVVAILGGFSGVPRIGLLMPVANVASIAGDNTDGGGGARGGVADMVAKRCDTLPVDSRIVFSVRFGPSCLLCLLFQTLFFSLYFSAEEHLATDQDKIKEENARGNIKRSVQENDECALIKYRRCSKYTTHLDHQRNLLGVQISFGSRLYFVLQPQTAHKLT